jgi:hypothetical protein
MKDQERDRVTERAERASEKYALKLASGRVGGRRDGDVELQAANYAAAQAVMGRLRAETAKVLDREGVSALVRPYYYNFVLKLARRDRELWVEAHRRAEARVQMLLWEGRGLRRDVLLAVAREVLNLDLSAPVPAPCQEPKSGLELTRD